MKGLFFAIVMLLSIAAFADVTIKEESDGSEMITYFSGPLSAHYVDGQLTNITDIRKGVIAVFNPMTKTYFQSTFAEMKTLANQLTAQVSQNPQLKEFMKQQTGTVSVAKQGTKKVAGFSCQEYTLTASVMQSSATVCISKELADIISKEANFKNVESLMDSLDMEDGMDVLGQKISELESKNGYIMSEEMSMMMGGGYSTIVTDVTRSKISRNVFNIPEGYRKVPMQEAIGGSGY